MADHHFHGALPLLVEQLLPVKPSLCVVIVLHFLSDVVLSAPAHRVGHSCVELRYLDLLLEPLFLPIQLFYPVLHDLFFFLLLS